MLDLAQPPSFPVTRKLAVTLQPSFLNALRGIWLLTWKSKLNWRLLTVGLASLILPLLVYITTLPPQKWLQRHSWFGNPAISVREFSRRLNRSGLALDPEQSRKLLQISSEEYARANRNMSELQSAQAIASALNEQIQACYGRIHDRARDVLDERQFSQYAVFEKRKLLEIQGQTREPMWGRTAPFYHCLIDFYFFVSLPLLCISACGALIREELQADTLRFLTTRPLSRAKLLVAKYLSQITWLQLVALVGVLLLFAAGMLRQVPGLGILLPLVVAAQCLAVPAWCALGTFLGLVTKRYMALALVYGFIVEMGIGRIPTNINSLSLMRHLKTLLAHNSALESIYHWSGNGVPVSVLALVLASGIFVTLSALLFTFNEYHHTAEMQK